MSTPPPDPQPPYGPGPYGSPGPQGYPQGHSQGYPGHPGPSAPQGYDPSQGYPPPQGYPPGPGYPPPGYPPPPGGGYGAPTPPRSKTPLIVGSVLALLLIAAGAAYFLFPGDAEAAEVFLVPAASTGPDPFSENPFAPPPDPAIAQPAAEGSAPVEAAPPAGPVQPTSGATPGLYGGTRDRASCDPDRMVAFLAANPDKAEAWVDALTADPEVRLRDGRPLTPATIPDYVDGLTSLTLMADTRVTNHGFRGGRPTRLQSVLQKGSAVMVDEYGVPRVKCYCGNPLLPPAAPSGRVRYEGPRWPDFDPNRTTVVGRPPTPVDTFIVRVPPNGELAEVPRGGVPGRPVPPEVFEDGEPGAPPPEAYVSSDPPQAYPDPPMADDPSPPASASSECSPEGTQPVTIEITNDMRETAAIFWVDENCNQQLYRRLAPGESYTQSTFAGHRWIANVEGMDHAQLRVSPSSTSWVIQ